MTRILLALLIALCLLPLGGWAQNCQLPDKSIIGDGRQCICNKGILLCLDYEPDKSNEWREKCDYWMGVMERRILEQKHDSFADVATAYCTRALLEEMKK